MATQIFEIPTTIQAPPPAVFLTELAFGHEDDLIGIKDRKYLDHTGLQLHRSITDMMRYAALRPATWYSKTAPDVLQA